MGTVLLALLAFAVGFVALAILGALTYDRLIRALVINPHQALADIVETGEVPARWRPADSPGQTEHRSGFVPRLDRLRRIAQRSTMVADGEDRAVLLARLDEVRSAWESDRPATAWGASQDEPDLVDDARRGGRA